MQQILKFTIEIFDVRNRTSIKIVNDNSLVKSIQIVKNTSLNNSAVLSFFKSTAYDTINIEGLLKLYNYVKIELELRESNPSNIKDGKGETFYFSGFINDVSRSDDFGIRPSSSISVSIQDYANLLKTTFYTKNLTFLEILNQAVPEFRLINLSEYLGDTDNKLLSQFYSPTQVGFIFFAFLFFKFMYRIVYDDNGQTKKTEAPDSREIFKKFKLYTPFGLNLPSGDSMLKGQETSLEIYKQLQGVAMDLYRYIYPEPIFEFSTYETVDSVILMVRFTPLMRFDRPILEPRTISFGPGDFSGEFQEKKISTQGSSFSSDSYSVIEYKDFGHKRIKSIREQIGVSPAEFLRDNLNAGKVPLLTTLQESIGKSKHISIEDLIANDRESDEITDKFFNIIKLDTTYVENLRMTRSANTVVNVIWTVPTTDTAILKMSGRELVYAYLEQKLQELGGRDKFGNYIYQQFNKGVYANPVFLMDYRGVFGQNFVSGDMNYFGFREFEIKWNYLSTEYSAVNHILKYVDKKILKEARDRSKDKAEIATLDDALKSDSETSQQTSSTKNAPRKSKSIFKVSPYDSGDISGSTGGLKPQTIYRQSSRGTWSPPRAKNKSLDIKAALSDPNFVDSVERNNFDISGMNNVDKIVDLVKTAKEKDTRLMGGFAAEVNSVIASAYRENEHLYEVQLRKPIDIKILPGMIVQSDNKGIKAQKPQFKGYVINVAHFIDFEAATMKTDIGMTRTASDDSGVVYDYSVKS